MNTRLPIGTCRTTTGDLAVASTARTPLPIAYWDERLSTAAAERMLIDADRSRARRAELVDKAAAAWVLQGALDRMG